MSQAVAIYDRRMNSIIDPHSKLEKLAGGAKHTEGVVHLPEDDSVVFSDVSGDRLFRWSAADGTSIIREAGFYYQNGNYLDLEGRLVSCSHGKRAIVRREHNGEWQIICDRCLDARSLAPALKDTAPHNGDAGSHRYQGSRLNSPNDLIVKSDGTIWFTDPPFGLTQPDEGCGGQQEQAGSFVFRFDPLTGEIDAVIKEMERPTLDNNLNGGNPRNGFVSQWISF